MFEEVLKCYEDRQNVGMMFKMLGRTLKMLDEP